MICPKCGKEMTLGKIRMFYGYRNTKGGYCPFWAENDYFTQEAVLTAKDAEQKGVGFSFEPPNDMNMMNTAFMNLPNSYACKDCKTIFIEGGAD